MEYERFNVVLQLETRTPHGYKAALIILLQWGAPMHREDYRGRTILHNTASEGKENIVRTLLENGADIKTKDYCGDGGNRQRSITNCGGAP